MTDRVLIVAVLAGALAAFAFGFYGWLHGIVTALPL